MAKSNNGYEFLRFYPSTEHQVFKAKTLHRYVFTRISARIFERIFRTHFCKSLMKSTMGSIYYFEGQPEARRKFKGARKFKYSGNLVPTDLGGEDRQGQQISAATAKIYTAATAKIFQVVGVRGALLLSLKLRVCFAGSRCRMKHRRDLGRCGTLTERNSSSSSSSNNIRSSNSSIIFSLFPLVTCGTTKTRFQRLN